ncbi:DUF3427 domain-containing protein [Microbispora sp. NEAU-D428]|uniref:DUF3427 domain-containing protein n=1 Tax=Microbispora sitophila TaxID=2771537 RepID=UPI001868C354|nr:DUF3427 domain-containing protein [Microbispora sitophila]MBE3009058.1 DUF3427 domain-containing protein [Microbispora sitophila]
MNEAAGIYEHLITQGLQARVAMVSPDLVQRSSLDEADADEVLVRHLAVLVRRALRASRDSDDPISSRVRVANRIAAAIADIVPDSAVPDDFVHDAHELLLAIAEQRQPDGSVVFPDRPEIPLSSSALLVNGRGQPQIGREIVRELASATRVDLLCAFIKWHGLRLVEEALRGFIARGGKLRVITTTYLGASEIKAIDRLIELGAEVKVSYETQRTRLHAKAWLFHRGTGLDTAYVGSSNLSRAALLDGLEWNVRLSHAEQPHILDTFSATFEEYWDDPTFERYDPERDRERLRWALSNERGGSVATDTLEIASIDVYPFGYQGEILEALAAAREVHGHHRNLVVMATGTGKTVVAALDYKRLRNQGHESLLFVAHTKEILRQSRSTFRQVLRDGSFGELLVDGERPQHWRHVFASIQSLARLDLARDLPVNHFDMVIVDEFHHAEAPSYAALLNHLAPRTLLGLTATPERTDGADILHWFDGHQPTVELRLWEAIERQFLVPFHYFGVHDDTDLSSIAWSRTGYDSTQLTKLYTGHDARVALVVKTLQDKLTDVGRMRAVGFCVSIAHAEFMARRFRDRGIPAAAVTSATPRNEREQALRDLAARKVNVVFTVDLFNEGVDVPAIDTVLFLRPTESATVFLQQLGRGLRLAEDKSCLTVLDFVGRQHARFRFDKRYRALTGVSRRKLEGEINDGFPHLPPGCHIDLDREVSSLVLANVRQALRLRWEELAAELRSHAEATLWQFLQETGLELEELYAGSRSGWAGLRRAAGLDLRAVPEGDVKLAGAIKRMLHIDDPERLGFLREILSKEDPPDWDGASERERRLLAMMHATLDSKRSLRELPENLGRLWQNVPRREELLAIVDVLFQRIYRVTPVIEESPLRLHATYTRDEILSAYGREKPHSHVAGVYWAAEHQADLFFVTINKSDKGFKPSTMYNDRAITPSLFQWESQSTTREMSETGQRYVSHTQRGSTVHLFIRESKESAPPYLYAGPMTYLEHEGERPMRIRWRLDYPLPADVFHYAKVTAG